MSLEGLAAAAGKMMGAPIPMGAIWTVAAALAAGTWYVSAQDSRMRAMETTQKEIKVEVRANSAAVTEVKTDIAVIKKHTENIERGVDDVREQVKDVGDVTRDVREILAREHP